MASNEKNIAQGVVADDDANPKEIQMVNMTIQDEAGELAAKALLMAELDKESSAAVRRKIDMRILPFLCITYALQFIDKTSLGYSSVYGIITDNNLVGQQYSWTSSIFYFGKLASIFRQHFNFFYKKIQANQNLKVISLPNILVSLFSSASPSPSFWESTSFSGVLSS